MNKPFYTAAARSDLVEILHFIAKDKPTAALSWIERLEARCLLIAENPEIGELQPHLGEAVRANVLGRYVIFHRQANNRVEILRVIAGDREIRQL